MAAVTNGGEEDLVAGKHRENCDPSELDEIVCNNFQNWSIRVEKSLAHHGGLEMLQTDPEQTGEHRKSSPPLTFSDQ